MFGIVGALFAVPVTATVNTVVRCLTKHAAEPGGGERGSGERGSGERDSGERTAGLLPDDDEVSGPDDETVEADASPVVGSPAMRGDA